MKNKNNRNEKDDLPWGVCAAWGDEHEDGDTWVTRRMGRESVRRCEENGGGGSVRNFTSTKTWGCEVSIKGDMMKEKGMNLGFACLLRAKERI